MLRWVLVSALLGVSLAGATVVAVQSDGPERTELNSESLGPDAASTPPAPEIIELYPNPAAQEDAGEFVTLQIPQGTNISKYSLADDTDRVPLSETTTVTTRQQTITFSTATNKTAELVERRIEPISGRLQLANNGDHLRLLRGETVVDSVNYSSAPESAIYHTTRGEWNELGATDRAVSTARGGTIETFVLPDEPDRAVNFLASASERILLAAYTLTSREVVDTLLRAHERGVRVEVLVDRNPVGGLPAEQITALDQLSRGGIRVQVLGGENARYRYHHAKYAVVDDRALVTTENWKESGIGGASSRGWAVVTDQRPIVEGLAETFRADAGWVDSIPWQEVEQPTSVDEQKQEQSYPTAFESATHSVEETRLLLAPDNAEAELRDTIRNAERSIDIKQMQIGDIDFPLLQEVIRAAQRGVDVRILLSGAWYVAEANRDLKRYLDEQAKTGNLPLEVQIADPDGEFEKIHAKGMIVDGETTVLGSLNWNNNSMRNNREVGILVESEGVAAYFGAVFENDWESGESSKIPVGYIAACALAAILAVLGARRIKFDS